ncbi:hypothetical protein Tco_0304169 [Tanacetum coccineum]
MTPCMVVPSKYTLGGSNVPLAVSLPKNTSAVNVVLSVQSLLKLIHRDEGGGDDVDGSVVVASNGGDGEGGVEIMPALADYSWPGGAERRRLSLPKKR